MVEALCTSEILVSFYRTIQYNVPEGCHPQDTRKLCDDEIDIYTPHQVLGLANQGRFYG
jgi:hypothetical protein